MSYEYTVHIPENERNLFRSIAKKMGWKATPTRGRRLSAYEKSKLEAKQKEYKEFSSVDALLADLNN